MIREIRTNFERFPSTWSSSGRSGTATVGKTLRGLLGDIRQADLVLINGDAQLVFAVVLAFIAFPWLRKPVVAVDLVLRVPEGLRAKLAARVKRFLFTRVDHFVHYFRDLAGYAKFYGIDERRSSFVHFKANVFERHDLRPDPDGSYVLCFGRSLRDYDTFFAAISQLPYPAAIPRPDWQGLTAHGSRFSAGPQDLPSQLTILDDDGNPDAAVRLITGARLVVIPTLCSSICASGVGTYLNAMLLGKCVIISEGPGASDVLSKEAIIVPRENPDALAAAISLAWESKAVREQVASAGHRLAASLGGERELLQRILDVVIHKFNTI